MGVKFRRQSLHLIDSKPGINITLQWLGLAGLGRAAKYGMLFHEEDSRSGEPSNYRIESALNTNRCSFKTSH
jgi:hypothetical protein